MNTFGRGQRVIVPDECLVQERRALAFRTVSPLYESIDSVAQSIVHKLKRLDSQRLPHTVDSLSIEVKATLEARWNELFVSAEELNLALSETLRRVGIGIQSGLMFGGFKQCRVKSVTLDTESQHFIIRLAWIKEPSRLKKFLARHH